MGGSNVNDHNKTKRQLIGELAEMRRQVVNLKRLDAERKEREDKQRETGTLVSHQAATGEVTKSEESERDLRWKTALLEAQINSSLDGILVVDNQGRKVLQNQRTVDLWKIPSHIA